MCNVRCKVRKAKLNNSDKEGNISLGCKDLKGYEAIAAKYYHNHSSFEDRLALVYCRKPLNVGAATLMDKMLIFE